MKKIISILLTVVMILSACVIGSVSAFAADTDIATITIKDNIGNEDRTITAKVGTEFEYICYMNLSEATKGFKFIGNDGVEGDSQGYIANIDTRVVYTPEVLSYITQDKKICFPILAPTSGVTHNARIPGEIYFNSSCAPSTFSDMEDSAPCFKNDTDVLFRGKFTVTNPGKAEIDLSIKDMCAYKDGASLFYLYKTYEKKADVRGKEGITWGENVSFKASSATQATISWAPDIKSGGYYTIYYKKHNDSEYKVLSGASKLTTTSFVWNNIASGSIYDVIVRGFDNTNDVSNIEDKVFYYTPVIYGLSATNATTGLKISWTAVPNLHKYRIYYKTSSSGSWTKITDVTDKSSYTWTSAPSGKTYYYTVKGVDDNNTTYHDSKGVSRYYLKTPTLSYSIGNGKVTFSWPKSTGAKSYTLYRQKYDKTNKKWPGWSTVKSGITAASYADSGVASGNDYKYTVKAINGSNTSAYLNPGCQFTYSKMPKVSSVTRSSDKLTIKWGSVGGAVKYRLYRKVNTGSWAKVSDVAGTSYTQTVNAGYTYTYTVRAISADGNFSSTYDSKGVAITYSATPKISSVTRSGSKVTIKFGKVTKATKYRIYYKLNSGSWKTLKDVTTNSYSYTIKKGYKYTYTVRAISSDGKLCSDYDTVGKSITYK